jgi:hypothetical protein
MKEPTLAEKNAAWVTRLRKGWKQSFNHDNIKEHVREAIIKYPELITLLPAELDAQRASKALKAAVAPIVAEFEVLAVLSKDDE